MKKLTQKFTCLLFTLMLLGLMPGTVFSADNIRFTDAPTTVTPGKNVTVKIAYSTNANSNKVPVQVRLLNSSGSIIVEETKYPSTSSNNETFIISIPGNLSAGTYKWDTQMFNENWSKILAKNNKGGVTVIENASEEPINTGTNNTNGTNSLRFNSAPGNVRPGNTESVKVAFTTNANSSKVPIQVRLLNSSGSIVVEITEYPSTSSTSQAFRIPIPGNLSNATYKWHTQMFNENWTKKLGHDTKTGVTVSGSGSGSDSGFQGCETGKSYCTTYNTGDRKPNNKLLPNTTSKVNGIYEANMYVANWKGRIDASWEYPENGSTSGKNFIVKWDNDGATDPNGHAEFDYKALRSNWTRHAVSNGYPTQISKIGNMENCTSTGSWTGANNKGRGHINITAWISKSERRYEDGDSRKCGSECDIIIHTWDNSKGFKNTFPPFGEIDTYTNNSICQSSKIQEKRNIGEIKFAPKGDGAITTYDVLRTKPGGAGEKASYNIIPKNSPDNFNRQEQYRSIDVKYFINKIMSLEDAIGDKVFNTSWHLQGMEWTVTGQSGDEFAGNSEGEWTFKDYYIPNVPNVNRKSKSNIEILDVEIAPNPFTNSFNIQYNLTKEEPVTIELFSQDGKLIEVFKNKENQASGSYTETVNTSNLPSGTYHIQITSSANHSIKKLVKF